MNEIFFLSNNLKLNEMKKCYVAPRTAIVNVNGVGNLMSGSYIERGDIGNEDVPEMGPDAKSGFWNF